MLNSGFRELRLPRVVGNHAAVHQEELEVEPVGLVNVKGELLKARRDAETYF